MSLDDSAWYVEVPLETDEDTLADAAVDVLQGTWSDWEPNEGDLEIVQIEALASMAAPLARQVSLATEAIFRTFGVELVGVPYQAGGPASTTVTFTLTDSEPHTVEDSSELDIDGVAFLTVGDAANAAGTDTIPGVPVVAAEDGVVGNGLGASVSRISALAFVADVSADATTSGGVDPQSDDDYLGYLSRKLQLRADTLVTKRDHEYWALSYDGVGRAYATNTADRHVTLYIADDAGEIVAQTVKDQMAADLPQYRLVNTVTTLADPSYTTIAVAYVVHALAGYDLLDLEARIGAMLASWLSPAGFAVPKFGDPGVTTTSWIGSNVVRRNSVIDRISDVEGVDYVDSVTLTVAGGVGAVDGNGNVVMGGTVALPRSVSPADATVNGPA